MKSERIKLSMDEVYFNELYNALETMRSFYTLEENKEKFRVEREENEKLINKLIRYGWFEEHGEDNQYRVELFPSEAREMIKELLENSILLRVKTENEVLLDYYNFAKEQHELLKDGKIEHKTSFTVKQAQVLYEWRCCGYEYLVRFKNGELYLVDHGHTKLIKTDTRWVDENKEYNDSVFEKCKLKLDFIKWENDEPTEIDKLLNDKGFYDENGYFKY